MKKDAILLLGPTGSGKTPLGKALQKQGLFNRPCVHFDFGARLRHTAEHGSPGLSEDDVAIVRKVLTGGALLEDETFYIARTLLENFIAEHDAASSAIIVLNGLPRHAGQARDVSETLNVMLVIALECRAETVHERIAGNTGGDRTKRTDDSVAEIERKLGLYTGRTRPLLEHYRAEGILCRTFTIEVDTLPENILAALDLG